jgi:hypothetical protein
LFISHLVVLGGNLHSPLHLFEVLLRSSDPPLRFSLERVQDVHGGPEPGRIDGSVGAAIIVLDHFQNSGATEPLERPGVEVLASELRLKKGKADGQSHGCGEGAEVIEGRTDPVQGFPRRPLGHMLIPA